MVLPLFAASLAAYPVYSLINPGVAPQAAAPAKKYLSPLDPYVSFRLCADSLLKVRRENNKLVGGLPDGGRIDFTIDSELQDRVTEVMTRSRVPFGVFVALEPKTGRVLAMAGHSEIDPGWESRCSFDLYPMASLFKIVTAAAAFEQRKMEPESLVAFRGKFTSENPRYWEVARKGNQQVTLAYAMGKSINPVFGRIASDYVGRDPMMSMVSRFGFNQTLFPNTPVMPSKALPPENERELAKMGAGLGREVLISPLHAAAVMGAIANNGVMMLPVLADRISNGRGETILGEHSLPIRKVVEPEIAKQIEKSLSLTVNSGTSRKAFYDRRGRRKLAEVEIAAKTGSISGKNPEGHYSWFAAYAPAKDPQIALVALVINRDKWKIKASQLGEQALEEFFR
ncbi:MAG TPA: penicillin-binding transpeptidase domain-containing protein [Verrucomicrobiae bacterium]|nr:penicillin-binding transpeptidase domain-containing protein [Verrucomicrobiae bacterium]